MPRVALHHEAMRPEACGRAPEKLSFVTRMHLPDKSCPEKLYGKQVTPQLLPFMMPGFLSSSSTPKRGSVLDS